jgi:hypothetical protein
MKAVFFLASTNAMFEQKRLGVLYNAMGYRQKPV